MDEARLHGLRGIGELQVVRSPERTEARGLWTLLEPARAEEILTLHESGEVVVFVGTVSVLDEALAVREAHRDEHVQVRIRSVETEIDETTGEIRITAHLHGLTPEEMAS